MSSTSNKIMAALQFAASKGLDVDDAVDQLTELVEAVEAGRVRKALVSIKTVIGTKLDGSPLVVGWDTCGECRQHISNCMCSEPKQPEYVAKFVAEAVARADASGLRPLEPIGTATDAPLDPPTAVGSKKSGPTCLSCKRPVTEEDADQNDDGTWMCLDCQRASA